MVIIWLVKKSHSKSKSSLKFRFVHEYIYIYIDNIYTVIALGIVHTLNTYELKKFSFYFHTFNIARLRYCL